VANKDNFLHSPPLTALIFTKLADAYYQLIFVGTSVTEFCTFRIEKLDGQNTGIAVPTDSQQLV
jgi:hypothetical protein